MDLPIRIEQASQGQRQIRYLVLLVPFLAAVLVLIFLNTKPHHPVGKVVPMETSFAALGLIALAYFAYLARLAARALVIDEHSIRMMKRGKVLWALPWSRYGGFKTLWPYFNHRTVTPFKAEFLDLEGKPVGQALLVSDLQTMERIKIIPLAQYLISRVPKSGFAPRIATRAKLRLMLAAFLGIPAIAVGGFVFYFWYLDAHFPSPWVETLILLEAPAIQLILWPLGRLYVSWSVQTPSSTNLEGFALSRGGDVSAVMLLPEKRYQYAPRESLARSVTLASRIFWILVTLFALPVVAIAAWALFDSSVLVLLFCVGVPLVMLLVLVSAVSLPSYLRARHLSASLDDTVSVSGEELCVDHLGQTHSYPLSSQIRWAVGDVFFSGQLIEFRNGKDRYYLDPRFLQEVR